MNDILEFLDEIYNLKALYNADELRNMDFDALIHRYGKIVSDFEKDLDEQYQVFQHQMDMEHYDPVGEY